MKWIGNRISWKDQSNKTTVVITPKKEGWQVALFFAWMMMFTGVGVIVIYQLFGDVTRDEVLMYVVFLSFWMYFEVKLGKAFLWLAKGREYIKLNDESISVKKSIFNYGKASVLYYENISKFQLKERDKATYKTVFENSFWVVGGERFELIEKNKTVAFGRKLEDQDAKLLFRIIEKRLNQNRKKIK
jgi:hypothetical protein